MRQSTNRLLRLMEEGIIAPLTVARTCLSFMSEDDVREMCEVDFPDAVFDNEEDDE